MRSRFGGSKPLHTKEMGKRRPPSSQERLLQGTLVDYYRESVIHGRSLLYAVPNGEKRDGVTAAMLTGVSSEYRARMSDEDSLLPFGQGVVPGVADLVLLLEGGRSIYIEVKAPEIRDAQGRVVRAGGRLRKGQRLFRKRVEELGFTYRVVTCIEEFDALLREVGLGMRTRAPRVRQEVDEAYPLGHAI